MVKEQAGEPHNFLLARHPLTRVPAGEPDMAELKPIAGRLLPHERSLSVPKMLSGANAFEISDIERMNTRAHQPGV